jgi:hypothetical protein
MHALHAPACSVSEAENSLTTCVQGMQLRRHIDNTLGQGDLREAVRLPIGEDLNEWLAVNSNNFFFALLLGPFVNCFHFLLIHCANSELQVCRY